jgi:hypothetical protein
MILPFEEWMACCVGFSDDWVDFSIVWPMKEWKFGLIRVHWDITIKVIIEELSFF